MPSPCWSRRRDILSPAVCVLRAADGVISVVGRHIDEHGRHEDTFRRQLMLRCLRRHRYMPFSRLPRHYYDDVTLIFADAAAYAYAADAMLLPFHYER